LIVYSRAGLELALALSEIEAAVRLAHGMTTVHWLRGRADSAEASARFAVDVAMRANDPRALETAQSNASDLAALMFKTGLDSAGGLEGAGTRPGCLVIARRLWGMAAVLFAAAGQHDQSVMAFLAVADSYLLQGSADSALAVARVGGELAAAKGLREQHVIAAQIRVRAFQAQGMMDSARNALQQASPGGERAERLMGAITVITRAVEQERRGQLDSAITSVERLLAGARDVNDEQVEVFALNGLGTLYWRAGRLEAAARAFERSAQLSARQADTTLLAGTLAMRGAALEELGALDSALAAFRRAYRLATLVRDDERRGQIALTLGFFWQRRSERDSARTYLERASQVPGFGRYPAVRLSLAWLAVERGDFVKARDHARGVLEEPSVADRYRMRARRTIGLALLAAGQKDSAAAYLVAARAQARALGLARFEMWILSELATVYLVPGRPDSLQIAVAYADTAASLAARARRWVGGDEMQLEAAEQANDVFELWAVAWSLIAALGYRNAELAALGAAERGRGQTLLDLMRRSNEEHPPGANLAAEAQAIVASAMRGRSAALVYLTTGTGLLLWSVSPAGVVHEEHRKVTRDSLIGLVRQFRAALGADEAATRGRLVAQAAPLRGVRPSSRATSRVSLDAVARTLAAILLPRDFAASIDSGTEVIVVPHGALGLVPFASLPVGARGQPLGLRYALRYAPSLATLGQVEARGGATSGQVRAREHPLVVGDPTMPVVYGSEGDTFRLKQLAGAAAEARAVADELGGDVLAGRGASEKAVRRLLPSATLVHLATHGYAYATQARARDSYVALAPDSLDGLLTVGEVLDEIQLDAELVVLSACQTGLGDVKEAEGTVGLQRAFLAKGARSVLVSLWSVSDSATGILMQRFYAHWLHDADTPSKAEALQRSQADVRAIPRFSAPRYWAAFQLVGAR
jgi:tetratricopeptide (TPR) repeat protein